MMHRLSYHIWNVSSDFRKISQCLLKQLTAKANISCREYRPGIFDEENDNQFFDQKSGQQSSSYQRQYRGNNDSFNYGRKRNFEKYDSRDHFEQQNRFGYPSRESYKMRSQNNFNRGFGNRKFDLQALPSADIDWKTLPPIEKNFYAEHPDVANRSEEEVENYRKNFSVSVMGSDIPNPITKFSELHLPDKLMEVIIEQEYAEPTPIQAQGWPISLSGRDMIGISQTGSGKTLVFMLPAIVHAINQQHACSPNVCKPQVLILAPTRELVQQIHQVSQKFIDVCGLYGACAYGGASKHNQLRLLRGANICIATPGRLIDFISAGMVNMQNCSYLVLDEADRMLDMGFEPQIRDIIDQIRPDRQTLMWSATWPKDVQMLAKDFLSDYVHVTIGSGELRANPNIQQNIYVMEENEKNERLIELLEEIIKDESKVLVFAQTKRTVDSLAYKLNRERIPVMSIHGDISQSRRDEALRCFRTQKSCVLVATDVAARGLDITDVQHVINFDFPPNIEDYIHRIGRTARGVSSGYAHSFFTSENAGIAKELLSVLKQAKQNINPELYTMVEANSRSVKRNRYAPRKWNYERHHQSSY